MVVDDGHRGQASRTSPTESGRSAVRRGQQVAGDMQQASDEAAAAQACEVETHLIAAATAAEEGDHLAAEAPVGESEAVQGASVDAQQCHGLRIWQPQRGRPRGRRRPSSASRSALRLDS